MRKGFLIFLFSSYGFLGSAQQLIDSLTFIYENETNRDTSYVKVINDLTMEFLSSNQAEAQDLITEAMRLSDSLDYQEGRFWATINRGNSFWFAGMYDAALDAFFRAAQLTDPKMTFPRLAVYNNIGEVFKRKNQFDSALVYLNLAKELAADADLRSEEVLLLYNISELYLKTGEITQAKTFIGLSVSKIYEGTNPRYEAYAWFGMAEVARELGTLTEAIAYHQKSYDLRKSINDVPGQINSLNTIAAIYLKQNKLLLADQMITESLKLSEQTGNKNFMSQTYLAKAELMKAVGKHEAANEWLMKHFSMKDSVDQTAFSDQVERIKTALNAEIKEKNFELLEEKQLLQDEVIKRQTWIILSVSALALVLFVFFFTYRRNLQREKDHSDSLNDLNNIILSKNQKIEEINAKLDHQLIHATKLLYESQKITKIDSWEYNFEDGVQWTGDTFDQMGMTDELENPVNPLIKDYITEESYDRVVEIFKSTNKEGLIFEEDVKIDVPDGTAKFFRFRYFVERSESPGMRAFGSSQEITDLVKTEEREKAIISSLFDLSRSANLSLVTYDFEQFVEHLLKQSTSIMEVAGAIFWMYDDLAGKLKCLKVHGLKGIEAGVELSMKEFPKYFQRLLDYRSTPVSDLSEDKITAVLNDHFYQPLGIKSLLDSKVEIEGELIGLFSIVHDQVKPWSYSDQRYVGSLTDIIASAYSTSLKKQLEREKGELIKTLLKRNENLEELTYVISHHLRGPLTRIMGLSNLYNDPQSKGIEGEIMSRINKSSHELDQVIKDLIEIIKYRDEKTPTEEIPLQDLVDGTIKEVGSEWSTVDKQIKVSIGKEIRAYGNIPQIQNVLYALISNAFKFRREDIVLELSIDARRVSGMIQISIADNGRGIDLTRFDSKIFKMYQRFHTEIPGTGIGLFIAKNLVESMGGRIDVSSLPMDGTVFTVELPDHAPMSISKRKLVDVA